MHAVFSRIRQVAAVFALGSFLASNSQVYDNIRSNSAPLPPVYLSHGAEDTLVTPEWMVSTRDVLTGNHYHSLWLFMIHSKITRNCK